MKKKFLLILAAVSCLSVSYGFASEKTSVQPDIKVSGFTFNDAVSESNDAGIVLLKSDKEKKEIEQNGFFDWLIKSEKYLLIGAIASTATFAVLSITGIVFMGAGWNSYATLYGLYFAGGILFGLSWLFFLGAGAFWAFWGIAQYLKKNDYQTTAFAAPIYNEAKPCNSSYAVGLSVSFY